MQVCFYSLHISMCLKHFIIKDVFFLAFKWVCWEMRKTENKYHISLKWIKSRKGLRDRDQLNRWANWGQKKLSHEPNSTTQSTVTARPGFKPGKDSFLETSLIFHHFGHFHLNTLKVAYFPILPTGCRVTCST